jgi:hypothetical protein
MNPNENENLKCEKMNRNKNYFLYGKTQRPAEKHTHKKGWWRRSRRRVLAKIQRPCLMAAKRSREREDR